MKKKANAPFFSGEPFAWINTLPEKKSQARQAVEKPNPVALDKACGFFKKSFDDPGNAAQGSRHSFSAAG